MLKKLFFWQQRTLKKRQTKLFFLKDYNRADIRHSKSSIAFFEVQKASHENYTFNQAVFAVLK